MHTFQPYPIDMLDINPFTKLSKGVGSRDSRRQGKIKHHDRFIGWNRCPLGQNVVFIFIRESRYTKGFHRQW